LEIFLDFGSFFYSEIVTFSLIDTFALIDTLFFFKNMHCNTTDNNSTEDPTEITPCSDGNWSIYRNAYIANNARCTTETNETYQINFTTLGKAKAYLQGCGGYDGLGITQERIGYYTIRGGTNSTDAMEPKSFDSSEISWLYNPS